MVCKTEIAVVSDNQVFVDRNAHDPAGLDELPGEEPVLLGRPGFP
jgi:hypothetical protein